MTAIHAAELAALAADLVAVLGRSEHFTRQACEHLSAGMNRLDESTLSEEAHAGLGEYLAIAYYKSLALLPCQSGLLLSVAELLLHYRFHCSLAGLYDHRAQHFWFRHGLDREIQESELLHSGRALSLAQQLEYLCFAHRLADYFAREPWPSHASLLVQQPSFTHLQALSADLWHAQTEQALSAAAIYEVYVLAPHRHIAILCEQRLCDLINQVVPFLAQADVCLGGSGRGEKLICVPLGTRKLSISKQGFHSCSTYFDGAKPVPFSLNRGLEPYLLLSPRPLQVAWDVRAQPRCFTPLLDSLSCLGFRDPADYRLGESAFLHRPLVLQLRQPLIGPAAVVSRALPDQRARLPVAGILLQADSASFAISPCHQLADRYVRSHGLHGHGPSGVLNQSLLSMPSGVLSTWRYERNFDSWSGRCADVARHPSLNFLAWERQGEPESGVAKELHLSPLIYSGYPSECKIEDLRLFSINESVYAIAALILSRSRYRSWLPEMSAEAAANNTIDDMLVIQALGHLDPERAMLAFDNLPILHGAVESDVIMPRLPGGFEKNWMIHHWMRKTYLFYSVQPWRVFEADAQLRHWRLIYEQALDLPASNDGPLRNSAHPFPLADRDGVRALGLVLHRRRHHSYDYDQYLMTLSPDKLLPQRISRQPILCVNQEAPDLDLGFRKNRGVCYVSAVAADSDCVHFYFNLFDCRTCVLVVSAADLLAMVDDDRLFVSVAP